MRIGFIGTGIMGSRMAAHLLGHSHELHIHNRTRHRARSLLETGAHWAESPAEAAEHAEVVITMLAHPESVQSMALGPHGFLASMQPGSIWIDCSTVKPSFSRQMAQEGAARGLRVHITAAPPPVRLWDRHEHAS